MIDNEPKKLINHCNLLDRKFKKFNWNYNNILNKNTPYICKRRIKVAMIDSGIDFENDLITHVRIGHSYVDNSLGLSDEIGHGTQIFGILNTLVKNIDVFPYKVINKSKQPFSKHLVKSIFDAVDNGVDIISVSYGSYKNTLKEQDRKIISAYNKAINYAYEHNVVVVSSAGNDGLNLDDLTSHIHLPSHFENVISVGGTTKKHSIASYSNYGKSVDIYAPSGEFKASYKNQIDVSKMILTYQSKFSEYPLISHETIETKGIGFTYGTSFSVPHAVAALVKEIDLTPNMDVKFYKNQLLDKSKTYRHKSQLKFKEVRV